MKFRLIALALALTTLPSLSLFALPENLTKDMVALDKRYIPALGLSGQPDQLAKAKLAFTAFESTWQSFKTGIAAQGGYDGDWTADLARIEGAVQEARVDLIGNSNGPAAHEALEAVRMTFLDARQRQGIPYFIDYLTLFHNSMEELIDGKPAKPLKDWSASELLSFEADLDLAIARWNKVKAMEALLPGAELASGASDTYNSQWQSISSIMAGMKPALKASDEKALAERLGKLKPNFIKTFFLFGDFPK